MALTEYEARAAAAADKLAAAAEAQAKAAADGVAATAKLAAAAEAQAKAAAAQTAAFEQQAQAIPAQVQAVQRQAAAFEQQAQAAAHQAEVASARLVLEQANAARLERQVAALEAAAEPGGAIAPGPLPVPDVGGGPAPLNPNQRAQALRQAVLLALIASGAYMRPNTASTPEGHAAEAARDAARLEANVAAILATSGPAILAQ